MQKLILAVVAIAIVGLVAPHLFWLAIPIGSIAAIYWVFIKVGEKFSLTPEQYQKREREKQDTKLLSQYRHMETVSKQRANRYEGFINPAGATGYVYVFASRPAVLDNQSYSKEAIKIGYTLREPYIRARELHEERNTYSGMLFVPLFWFHVSCCFEVEQKAHEILIAKKAKLWRELFDVSADEAKQAILEAIDKTEGAKLLRYSEADVASPAHQSLIQSQKMWQKMLVDQQNEEIPF